MRYTALRWQCWCVIVVTSAQLLREQQNRRHASLKAVEQQLQQIFNTEDMKLKLEAVLRKELTVDVQTVQSWTAGLVARTPLQMEAIILYKEIKGRAVILDMICITFLPHKGLSYLYIFHMSILGLSRQQKHCMNCIVKSCSMAYMIKKHMKASSRPLSDLADPELSRCEAVKYVPPKEWRTTLMLTVQSAKSVTKTTQYDVLHSTTLKTAFDRILHALLNSPGQKLHLDDLVPPPTVDHWQEMSMELMELRNSLIL